MEPLYNRWDTRWTIFGNLAVIAFLVVQCLDGVLTYLGVTIWGPGIEANPIVSSAMAIGGAAGGLAGAKLVAIAFGIVLHLRRVHMLVAFLTVVYFAVAILPWTALFLAN
jgi:hypothetical protein